MPVRPTYPGVYIEEIASGVRTIVGVATSVGAFVDAFSRGPQDVAVQVFGMADFTREFGGLHRDSPGSYAVRQFFENGGSEAWVVRVARTGSATASDNAVAATRVLTDGAAFQVVRATAGRRVRGRRANDPGFWGNNLYIDIDYDCLSPATQFNMTISEIVDREGRRVVARTETFRNLTMRPGLPGSALDVVNEGSRLVQLDRAGLAALGEPPQRPAANGTLGGELTGATSGPATSLTLTVNLVGRPAANAQTLSIAKAANAPWAEVRSALEAAIRNAARGATVAAADRDILAGVSVRLIGNGTTVPFRLHVVPGRFSVGFDPATRFVFDGAASGAGADGLRLANAQATVADAFWRLADGQDGTMPVPDAALVGNEAAKTGLYALEDVDLFNILCLPRAADLTDTAMRAVYAEATGYCERRRAMLLIDVPEATNDLERAQAWLTANETLRHRNAAVYFPRVRVPDPLNANRPRPLGASGTIAGLYARADSARGVWKAPAGTDARLRNVDSLDYLLTDLQNGVLNPLGVNCLRTFPVYGTVAWGSRTLEGADALASDFKYVPVRRFTLFLEESLYRGTKWVVFEPNDEPLWAQIRLNLGAFMQSLFRQGAFQGTTPREAYFVKCDRETTTQDDINRGVVNIVVGFAPLKPAEFVIIRIQQMAGQIET